jgi:elongation factor 1 alpha-like protein
LAKALGVRRLVVLVNKMDEVNWSQNRYEEIREGVTPFL